MRDDAIMATGRSDYPNQVNNVLGFPYIFRGALDVRATTINMEMKIAAARALAELAREDVPDEVAAAYGARPKFGPDYIIPVPFDPRLISHVPPAVAQAAMDTGVARKPIADMDAYRQSLRSRRDPVAGVLQQRVRAAAPLAQARRVRRGRGGAGDPRRRELRARGARHRAAGRPRGADPPERARTSASSSASGIEIINAALSTRNAQLRRLSLRAPAAPGLPAPRRAAPDQPGPQHLRRLHGGARRRRRHGHRRHPQLFGGAGGRAPRHRSQARPPRHRPVVVLSRGRTVLVADTAITEMPKAEELAEIAIEAAGVARRMGYEPRVALLAFSTFGHPPGERSARVHRGGEDPRPAPRRFRIRGRDGGRRRAQSRRPRRPIRSAG